MPKMKTHRCAAKRFRVLKSGLVKKIRRTRATFSTRARRERNLRKGTYVSASEQKNIRGIDSLQIG